MVGLKFGRLFVSALSGKDKHGNLVYSCVCECGQSGVFVGSRLRSGETRSCGCFHSDQLRNASTTHGMTRTPTYRSWQAMRQRCNYKGSIGYETYGGRGIKVCKEWDSFEVFLSDMGERPDGKTLDRVDPNGDYCKNNCRWISRKEQNRNRRDNRCFEFQGALRTIPEIAEMVGLKEATLRRRLVIVGEQIDFAVRPVSKRAGAI